MRPYSCPTCDKSFSQKINLESHIRVHTKERPFSCHLCEKSFGQVTTLNQHLRVHLGIKPYKCNVPGCPKRFTQSSNLKDHLKIHERAKTLAKKVDCPEKQEQANVDIHTGDRPLVSKPQVTTVMQKLNFTPVAYWYQCQVCKILLEDKKQFIIHKKTRHVPPPTKVKVKSKSPKKSPIKQNQPSDGDSSDLEIVGAGSSKPKDIPVIDLIGEDDTDEEGETTINLPTTKSTKEGREPVSRQGSVSTARTVSSPIDENTIERSKSVASADTIILNPFEHFANFSTRQQDDTACFSGNMSSADIDIGEIQVKVEDTSMMEVDEPADKDVSLPAPVIIRTGPGVNCCICKKHFKFKAQLNGHLSIKHLSKTDNDGKPIYKCGLCPESFKVPAHVRKHSWTHTQEIRYRCPACSKGFVYKKSWERHVIDCQKLTS